MTEHTSNESNHTSGFAFLNKLSTDELKNILRIDCFSDDHKKLDDDTISEILQIIAQRETDARDIDANLLWENLKRNICRILTCLKKKMMFRNVYRRGYEEKSRPFQVLCKPEKLT